MKARPTIVFVLVAAMLLAVAACDGDDDSGGATGAVAVSGVWARTSPATAKNGAVYMTVRNGTALDDALVGASVASSVAKRAELHETVVSNGGMASTATTAAGGGMMTMKPVGRIPVKAGATVTLKPGGYHVMLFDLAAPLEAGSTFEVTLTFEQAGTKTVKAEVRAS